MRKYFLMFYTVTIAGKMIAQQPPTSHWVTVQTPVVFNSHWQMLNEASYRTLGEKVVLNQLFLRMGTRYTFNPKWNVAASLDYVHARVKPYDKDDLEFGNELRPWQEVIHRYPVSKNLFMHHRFRLEERFFQITSLNEDYKALRFRYRLALLKKISPKWDLQIAEEYLEQLLLSKLMFNQNRLSFSGFFRYGKNAHLEATYYWVKYSKTSQHVFSIAFQNRFIVKSKKKTSV